MRWTDGGLCTRDGWLRADPQRSQFHPTNLFLSFNLWCKDLVPQKRGKGKAVSVLIVLATGLSFCAEQGRLCTRDGWLRIDPQQGQFHPTNLFLGLNLWCKDLSYKKEKKGNEVSVLNVSATGLSLCTEQRVDFVWEMGDWELTLNAVSFTQQISFLVLICDAKTWSLKKEKGNEVSVLNVLATGPSLALIRE